MPKRQTEHDEQVALFNMAWANRQQYPEARLMFAIPNGGHRHKAVAAKLRAEGVKPGIPDLFLPVARGGYHGLFIEMKAKGGRLRTAQIEMIAALQTQGYHVEVCYGWQEAWEVIVFYLRLELERA